MGEVVKEPVLDVIGINEWSDLKPFLDKDFSEFVTSFPDETALLLRMLVREKINKEEEDEIITLNGDAE